MSLGDGPGYWEVDGTLVRFRYHLPPGVFADVHVHEDGKLLTVISQVIAGDATTPSQRIFNMPDGLDPAGCKTEIDGGGVLTVTFSTLKPEKKKLMPRLKKMMGRLLKAVPPCFVVSCKLHDEMSSDDR